MPSYSAQDFLQFKAHVFADLPAAASWAGMVAYITNGSTNSIGTTVAGGGSYKVFVRSDGATWLVMGAGPVIVVDTIKNILALTSSAVTLAFATDIQQFLVADGSSWQIDSSYTRTTNGLPDLGADAWSNRVGYGSDYVTDKLLANIQVGHGSFSGTKSGQLRYNAAIGTNGALEVYNVATGTWHQIVDNLSLFETSTELAHTPVGYTAQITVFNGDSLLLGLNGLPLVQGYTASMGAYPVQQSLDGGAF